MENQMYPGGFENWDDVISQFEEDPRYEPEYVFAAYEIDGNEGDAMVIYSYNGINFFYVGGYHCSCYGLEGQFSPDEMTADAVKKVFTDGATDGVMNLYKQEVLAWLTHIHAPVVSDTGVKTIVLPTKAVATIGTMTQYGTATFIERLLSTEVGGKEVEVFRGAYNPTFFEVKVEGSDKMLRIGIEELLSDSVKALLKDIEDDNSEADVG